MCGDIRCAKEAFSLLPFELLKIVETWKKLYISHVKVVIYNLQACYIITGEINEEKIPVETTGAGQTENPQEECKDIVGGWWKK